MLGIAHYSGGFLAFPLPGVRLPMDGFHILHIWQHSRRVPTTCHLLATTNLCLATHPHQLEFLADQVPDVHTTLQLELLPYPLSCRL